MFIRPANNADAAIISKLVVDSSVSAIGDFTDEGWEMLERTNTIEAVQNRFNSEKYFALICEVGGLPVGYLAMIDYEKIDHMFVLAEYRERGIATKLWAEAHEICSASGYGRYYWVRSSTYAEPVYESFGFRRSGERQSSSGISFQLMEKGVQHAS